MKKAATSEEKTLRENQAKANKAADWARVLKLTAKGGGSFVMVKRGK